MSDEVTRLAILAADVCFARQRTQNEEERRALNAQLQRYVVLIAVERGTLSRESADRLLRDIDGSNVLPSPSPLTA